MAQGDLSAAVSSPPRPVSLVGLPIVKVPGGQKIISILIEATVWLVGVPSTTSDVGCVVIDPKSLLTTRV